MTLTILLLWGLGIAFLIGVAVMRGKSVPTRSEQTADNDAVADQARDLAASVLRSSEEAAVGNGVLSVRILHRTRTANGQILMKRLESSALGGLKPDAPSIPAKGREPFAR